MAFVTLSWAAAPATDNVTGYKVYGANGTSTAFGSCTLLATVSGLTWTDSGLPNNQARTYYIVAVNAIGSSSPQGPINITTAAATALLIANNLSDVASKVAAKDNISVKGTTIASAATTDLSTATGDFVDISGTTTITAFGTTAAGVERTVRFTGILTLTYNATSLILPSAANITTAAGDTAVLRSLGSGNWLCVDYARAAGTALVSSGGGGGGGTGMVRGFSPPLASAFTLFSGDAGAAVLTDDSTVGLVVTATTATTGAIIRGGYKALPAGDFNMTARIQVASSLNNYIGAGIAFYENATGKCTIVMVCNDYTQNQIRKQTIGGTYTTVAKTIPKNNDLLIRIERVGANMNIYRSADGANWGLSHTFGQTSYFTTAPDRIGPALWLLHGTDKPILTVPYWTQDW
jgi:hypothetical protein